MSRLAISCARRCFCGPPAPGWAAPRARPSGWSPASNSAVYGEHVRLEPRPSRTKKRRGFHELRRRASRGVQQGEVCSSSCLSDKTSSAWWGSRDACRATSRQEALAGGAGALQTPRGASPQGAVVKVVFGPGTVRQRGRKPDRRAARRADCFRRSRRPNRPNGPSLRRLRAGLGRATPGAFRSPGGQNHDGALSGGLATLALQYLTALLQQDRNFVTSLVSDSTEARRDAEGAVRSTFPSRDSVLVSVRRIGRAMTESHRPGAHDRRDPPGGRDAPVAALARRELHRDRRAGDRLPI